MRLLLYAVKSVHATRDLNYSNLVLVSQSNSHLSQILKNGTDDVINASLVHIVDFFEMIQLWLKTIDRFLEKVRV